MTPVRVPTWQVLLGAIMLGSVVDCVCSLLQGALR